jgi:16S rRNA (adenine1518-N6/adenine1519-N6)-dimethyltransferase
MKHVTPSRARDLLRRHGLAAKRSLGQHFLVDPNTVRRIVRLAGVTPEDTVLEIGPGLGSLTVGLATQAARVVAVEIDPGVAEALSEVVGGAPNVEVVVADALSADIPVPEGTLLVANLPYNVATPVFVRVLEEMPHLKGGLVMVQREVGRRWCAGPGSKVYGAVTLKIAYHAEAEILGEVPPTVFHRPPKVRSVLVGFRRRPRPGVDVDPGVFFAFVAGAFRHRRKTIRNALVAEGVPSDAVERALSEAGIDPSVRPEALDLVSFAALWAALGRGS